MRRWWGWRAEDKMLRPTDTEEASYHRKALFHMSGPVNRDASSCFCLPFPIIPQTEMIIHIFTHPGRRPTQKSHPGGLEVHIKADYRVDEASAKLSASRHTAHYFWPRLRWHHPWAKQSLWNASFTQKKKYGPTCCCYRDANMSVSRGTQHTLPPWPQQSLQALLTKVSLCNTRLS